MVAGFLTIEADGQSLTIQFKTASDGTVAVKDSVSVDLRTGQLSSGGSVQKKPGRKKSPGASHRAFDRGGISVSDDHKIVVSSRIFGMPNSMRTSWRYRTALYRLPLVRLPSRETVAHLCKSHHVEGDLDPLGAFGGWYQIKLRREERVLVSGQLAVRGHT